MDYIRGYDKWLTTPPDDDPVCEDGCGEYLVRDCTGVWLCENKFCPTKFQGLEKEMAEALVEALDDVRIYKRYKVKYVALVESLSNSGLE